MKKRKMKIWIIMVVLCVVACFSSCGNAPEVSEGSAQSGVSEAAATVPVETAQNEAETPVPSVEPAQEAVPKPSTEPEAAVENQPEPQAEVVADIQLVESELVPSYGLEFESNGDGTATLLGMGICKDTDIVIPAETPNGEKVTVIDKNAFYGLEDVESVTFLNGQYEIKERAFQYGEMTTVRFIGGSVTVDESVFSSCEDLEEISFDRVTLDLDEYAFYGVGTKTATVSFSNCTGEIDDRAFQYGEFGTLTISDSTLSLHESVFSSCEKLTAITISNSKLETGEYAFYGCGKSAVIDIVDSNITLGDRAFQYSSIASLSISGPALSVGESCFSSAEDLTGISINSNSVFLDEYAFYGIDDLTSASICDNGATENQIELDDRVFQYCEKLENVTIGYGTVEIGKYCFGGTSESFVATVAGGQYSADMLDDGLK